MNTLISHVTFSGTLTGGHAFITCYACGSSIVHLPHISQEAFTALSGQFLADHPATTARTHSTPTLYTVIGYDYTPGHDCSVVEWKPLPLALHIMAAMQQKNFDVVLLIQSQYT